MTGHDPVEGTAHASRITVEVPVLRVGSGTEDFERLGMYVESLRKPAGLHMTLLHVGILDDLVGDIVSWTSGRAKAEEVRAEIVAWLHALPVLEGFLGKSSMLVSLGGGRVAALEVGVPQAVHDYQSLLVQGLHVLLDQLGLDNIDDFILSSRALGYRSPRWIPHVAIGKTRTRHEPSVEIAPLPLEFGDSRIRNAQSLPTVK
ncbi:MULTISPECIES: hypothetical protein [unclassified Paenarthrobacter]|uniref:hypothetical protein n=1 Tax=unclassified Paenarthrobacter TaxID=2634190 RepID=UPI003CED552F